MCISSRLVLALICVGSVSAFAGCGRNNSTPAQNNGMVARDMGADMSADMSFNGCEAGGALCALPMCSSAPACQGGAEVALCGVDERVEQERCVPCEAGTRNDPDDDATGEDTTCDAILCAANEAVSEHRCVPCPGDLENMAGDNAASEDTLCDGPMCPSDHRVQDAACVPCEPGATRPAGDDTAAGDTLCAPVTCGADEFVRERACLACPDGLMNEAGDDASGQDTTCEDACSPYIDLHCSEYEQIAIKAASPRAEGFQDFYGDFGKSVAIDGDLMVVGHPHDARAPGAMDLDDTSADANGAAYLYIRDDAGVWKREAIIKPATAQTFLYFGSTVAIEGDLIAVRSNHARLRGTVHLYKWSEAEGIQVVQSLTSGDSSGNDSFGESIAIDDGVIFVGMPSKGSDLTGQVRVFDTNVQGIYSLEQTLEGTSDTDRFGQVLSVRDGQLLVSTQSKRAELFARDEFDTWNHAHTFEPWDTYGTGFGSAVALVGGIVAVGAGSGGSLTVEGGLRGSGAVYLFERSEDGWQPLQRLEADVPGRLDAFGSVLAASDEQLAVGVPLEDSGVFADGSVLGLGADPEDNSASNTGAIYLFEPSPSGWRQTVYIKTPAPDNEDRFGAVLALDRGTLVASSLGDDSGSSGVGADVSDGDAANSGAVFVHRVNP